MKCLLIFNLIYLLILVDHDNLSFLREPPIVISDEEETQFEKIPSRCEPDQFLPPMEVEPGEAPKKDRWNVEFFQQGDMELFIDMSNRVDDLYDLKNDLTHDLDTLGQYNKI